MGIFDFDDDGDMISNDLGMTKDKVSNNDKIEPIDYDFLDESSMFRISKATLLQDAYDISALIDIWSTKMASAKHQYGIIKAARDAALNNAKVRMREFFSGEKKVTNDVVESKAMQDPDYCRLVTETVDAEQRFNVANGKLQAAFTKASMLKGLLFAMGKEMRVSDDVDLSSLPDLSIG